ncbi:MAG: helix-turn-helix domain-containing protein [Enterococcus sp.]|uniref:helix-turn-helix domain-containing protein n=1 Tax=Enterococcus sp. TaxID=35783 RepID=UPI00264886A1|nr:helix-turn-helix domain-containing protein [Enterococcus sp.]MDN6004483.1 helix-turn-helix domain-containing protein [Enterococcus sp.]MDN6517805.1 helix-turn-helix domain-containing protein [Enterococcus sp.]MDN6561341.1 helix-turn-helix domain-containing protein [Enterococcus sp.]MDN6617546.1 helix-turn-helix domain-containing protein [Enterococcus sp.]MDN6777733.1 helix-turn-helix domain-containing protein [Enterococcus sp.]
MNQILILTKNVLAEQEIQEKLQVLDYEVYCSSNVYSFCSNQNQGTIFFKFFQYIILSETLCETEATEVTLLLKEYPVNIIRKVKTKVTEVEQKYLSEGRFNAIITSDDSSDELRECLHTLGQNLESSEASVHPHRNDKVIQLSGRASMMQVGLPQSFEMSNEERKRLSDTLQQLTLTELKILDILIQAGNKIVGREEICRKVWNGEVNNSHKASLSSTISKIKIKFEQTFLEKKAVHTVWGKGYRINIDLLEKIQMDDSLQRIVTTGKVLSGS